MNAAVQVVLLLLLLLSTPLVLVRGELVLVYSIQRHGARNVLPKSAILTESGASGGPTLLPAGQQQCHDAGVAFGRRYIAQTTCAAAKPPRCLSAPGREAYGVINTPGVGFHNYNSFANSSALDRTIMSANTFLDAAFPTAPNASNSLQTVPVYSVPDSEDWRIRGYAKCPTYQRRLEAWLSSEAFRAKEAETQGLRDKVQQLVPQLNTSLAMWWDVYDTFQVWHTYGVGSPVPKLDNATFSEVVELAMWLETSKMAPELTSNLLGGGLLADVLARMAAAEEAASSPSSQAPYYRLVTVSSHYNTQLGLLSALAAGAPAQQRPHHPWQHKIPALAAVLAFELHRDAREGSFAVRAVVQDGPKAAYVVLPLPCAEAGDEAEALAGPGSCTLGRFRALAGPQALNGSADWCAACENGKVLACQLHSAQRQLVAAGLADPSSLAGAGGGSSDGGGSAGGVAPKGYSSAGMVAVWCIVSVAAAALLAAAGALAWRRVRQQGKGRQQQQQYLTHGLDAMPMSLSSSSRGIV